MGNQNPRSESEAAPDESVVMREYRPANIRLIIVAVADSVPCSVH
jgi:predicted secreted protein